MNSSHFGEHLMIDGYHGSYKKLNNRDLVFSVLDKLPEKLEMRKLTKPRIMSAPDNGIKDCGGWSGFVIIAESHISIHTFPARGFLTADIYTCKNGLDRNFVKQYFIKKFNLKSVEENFVKRGKKYPSENIF